MAKKTHPIRSKRKHVRYVSEYWCCFVGPTTRDKLPPGADAPMRDAVEKAFFKTTGCWPDTTSSGWGCTQKEMDDMRRASNKHFSKRCATDTNIR